MSLTDLIRETARLYLDEKTSPLRENNFAEWFRREAFDAVHKAINRPDLKVEGSVGQGNWAEIPWVGIFNIESTTSATSGIYVVYLFSADLKTVYLCQGQGVTKVRDEFKRDRLSELERRVIPPISIGPESRTITRPWPAAVWV